MKVWTNGITRGLAAWLVLLLTASVVAAQPELVVLDTDAAVFNDDGAVLELMDVRDVPLFVGAHAPLVNSPQRARIYQQQWGRIRFLGGFAETGEVQPPHGGRFAELRPQAEDAVSFLIRTIEQNPDRITVLAIGPLTNLAILLQLRPDLAPRIKRLVFMGGNARVGGNVTPYAEFNFFYDPEAARRVLHSEISEFQFSIFNVQTAKAGVSLGICRRVGGIGE